jgi:hypothetical protein
MFRILFLLLIVMSSLAAAQTEDQPQARKIDEFSAATNGYVKMKMDYFYVELDANPSSQGYIINYGTEREIAIREKQIRSSIFFRKYDSARITFVRGGFWETVKTELWIVPPGAENPSPNSSAEKIDEFEKISGEHASARIEKLYENLSGSPNLQGYIINFGSAKVVAAREQQIKKYILGRKLLLSRVTFKNGGLDNSGKTELWTIPSGDKNKSKTQIWIVPAGAKPPGQ